MTQLGHCPLPRPAPPVPRSRDPRHFNLTHAPGVLRRRQSLVHASAMSGAAMIGNCSLCLNESRLQDSHLMKAIYCSLIENSEPAPFVANVARGTAVRTSRQFRKHLLCSECEQRLNRNGENHVLGQALKQDGNFALRDALKSAKPSGYYEGKRVFLSEHLGSEFNSDAYRYFAASMLWRASVTSHIDGTGNRYHGALGSKYQKCFRRFLLGEQELPKPISFGVFVDFSELAARVALMPIAQKIRRDGRLVLRTGHALIAWWNSGSDPFRNRRAVPQSAAKRMWEQRRLQISTYRIMGGHSFGRVRIPRLRRIERRHASLAIQVCARQAIMPVAMKTVTSRLTTFGSPARPRPFAEAVIGARPRLRRSFCAHLAQT
jgi:hypothetical protein